MQAVKSIVNGTAFPSPYIIFGPPGTGKTATIVETVGQLWKMIPNSHVLVTAQSNAACDEIARRLLKIMPRGSIYRFYARSFENNQERIDEVLIDISNIRTGQHEFPGYNELYSYRVVICTLITAGRLVLANLNPHHFTHVFIDECASSTEVTSLIPIAGMVTTKKQVLGNVILAGDIQQLGPILRTGFSNRLSFGEREELYLCNMKIYLSLPISQTKH
jgi:helicase MOV-10